MIKLSVIGNVGRDAEVKEVNGRKCISFTIATNKKIVNPETGEVKDKTTWVSCSKWVDTNASTEVAKYISKGLKIYVEGEPTINMYKDQNNKTAASLNLSVNMIELISSKKESEETEE